MNRNFRYGTKHVIHHHELDEETKVMETKVMEWQMHKTAQSKYERKWAQMSGNDRDWAQILALICARLHSWPLKITEHKLAQIFVPRSFAVICTHICTKYNIWTERKIIYAQLRSVRLSATDTFLLEWAQTSENWGQLSTTELIHYIFIYFATSCA